MDKEGRKLGRMPMQIKSIIWCRSEMSAVGDSYERGQRATDEISDPPTAEQPSFKDARGGELVGMAQNSEAIGPFRVY